MFGAVLAWSQVGNWPWWGVNSQGGFELTATNQNRPTPMLDARAVGVALPPTLQNRAN